jgi:ketosteroid isomerase-like protein
VQIDVLGDTAMAFFTSRSSVKAKGHPTIKYEPIGHVSMVFRRTSEGWCAIHFHESSRSAQAAQVMQAIQTKPSGGRPSTADRRA